MTTLTDITLGDEKSEARENQTAELASGKTIGFAEYGDLKGKPVFYFHGFPSSRLEGACWAGHAEKEGVRLICLDRGGVGLSDYEANRRLVDYPGDVQELARYLGIEAYYVMGLSGGGPYAYTCAKYIPPSKLKGVAIVNGLGPKKLGHMSSILNMFWCLSRLGPISRWTVNTKVEPRQHFDPEAFKKAFAEMAPPPPNVELSREAELSRLENWSIVQKRSSQENFKQGPLGYIREAQICTDPWGFELSEIECDRIHVWQSAEDDFIPVEFGRNIAELIPHAKYTEVPKEGHTSLVFHHGGQVLRELVSGE